MHLRISCISFAACSNFSKSISLVRESGVSCIIIFTLLINNRNWVNNFTGDRLNYLQLHAFLQTIKVEHQKSRDRGGRG